MRRKIVWGILILGSLSLIAMGCSPTIKEPGCEAPYKVINNLCCLDQNNNNVCDDKEQQVSQEACKSDADCELDGCIGCINTEWGKVNPVRPECARFELSQYECKCVRNACTEVQKTMETKINAGEKIRFGEEKLPLMLEMQKNTKILFVTVTGDEVYTLDSLQETQITIFYEKDRFIIKKGTSQIIGPLEFVYSGVNPPKSGNYAMIKIIKAEA